jgi:hypothetical protein
MMTVTGANTLLHPCLSLPSNCTIVLCSLHGVIEPHARSSQHCSGSGLLRLLLCTGHLL